MLTLIKLQECFGKNAEVVWLTEKQGHDLPAISLTWVQNAWVQKQEMVVNVFIDHALKYQGNNAMRTLVWPLVTQVGTLESCTFTVQLFSTLHKSRLKM